MSTSAIGHSGARVQPLTVAWYTYFPVEWLPEPPPELRDIRKQHPATWQRVLWDEFCQRDDLKLHIFSLRREYERSFSFSRANTTFHCLKTAGGLRAPTLYWLDTVLLWRKLRRISPHLCHAWGSEFGTPIIASRLRYPTLVTMQGILEWLGGILRLNGQQRVSAALERPGLRRARVVTAESRFALDFLRQRYAHLQLIQVEHAPNPLFFGVQRQPQRSPLRFMCVSSFTKEKGADLLLDALKLLAETVEFELVWVGSGPREFQNEMQSSTPRNVWERIQFRHNLTPAEIAQELARATVFLYPTRADNSPNAVKEAVVAGVPVVASKVGGIPDYVTDGKNGFLFTPGDSADCRAAIKETLAHPEMGRGFVQADFLRAMRDYLSPARMAESFRAAYDLVLGNYRG